jgi:molybdopterin-guanine dinucleotide biosynthesis protein A
MIDPGVSGITGIILAGGESKRMGAHKPLVEYKGKPLINWVFDALKPVCQEIIIIANSGDFSHLDARVYPDNYPGTGPAAGIESGLSHCLTPLALICSCDTPNLSSELFDHLISSHEGYDISIASHDGTNEPLIGVYSQSVHAIFRAAILSGDPHPPRIIRQCTWQEIPIAGDSELYRPDLFLNLNSPSDLIS